MITLETDKKLKYAIAIDLGGTSIKSAIVDSGGKIHKHFQIESYAQVSPKKVIEQITKCIIELKKDLKKKTEGI